MVGWLPPAISVRVLDPKDDKALYTGVEKGSDNFGRVFLHFRWK